MFPVALGDTSRLQTGQPFLAADDEQCLCGQRPRMWKYQQINVVVLSSVASIVISQCPLCRLCVINVACRGVTTSSFVARPTVRRRWTIWIIAFFNSDTPHAPHAL
uniref:Uncharacterized protein n=1 Tax=Plectus sambesii TaxID=2011161 RepID=A0A914VLA3_9BILA